MTVYDTEELKLRYPDIAGNILKISDAGEMEVALNDKELEIIKAEFDKTIAEYKRIYNKINRENRIKKNLNISEIRTGILMFIILIEINPSHIR